jgi:hypothetical protein
MANLKRRIQQLEAASPQADQFPMLVVRGVPGRDCDGKPLALGELEGMDTGYGYVRREAGESEEALQARALNIAKAKRAPRCGIVLIEDRGAAPVAAA